MAPVPPVAIANVTITAKTGAGQQLTSKVFTGVKTIHFNLEENIIRLKLNDNKIIDFDYNGVATITYTISGQVATVAIS
jgi:hypothetical protein